MVVILGLDKVTHFNVTGNLQENGTATVYFNCPRGSYDKIRVDCNAQDQRSLNSSRNLTTNVTNCSMNTSISISGIVSGVTYECQAFTVKETFTTVNSTTTKFSTREFIINQINNIQIFFYLALKSVLYDGLYSTNNSPILFNVIPQSDFDQIVLTCIIADHQTLPCSDLTLRHDNGSTELKLNGTLGCDYVCSFTTEKENYPNVTSENGFNFLFCEVSY